MPKTKIIAKTSDNPTDKIIEKKIPKPGDELEKIIEIDSEDKDADLELIPGEPAEEDPEDEEVGLADDDLDPFKDKWEE
jgi:hypothetical protein